MRWDIEDSAAARKEGWDVFHVNSDHYEIQKCDDLEMFAEDPFAVFHVYDLALTGSPLHRKALLLTLAEENARPRTQKNPLK